MILDHWMARIADVETVDEVLVTVTGFLKSRPAGFLEGLPYECRPPELILTAQDVSSYAFVLMHRCMAKDESAALLGMNRFFTVASQRLSVILTPQDRFTPRPRIDFT